MWAQIRHWQGRGFELSLLVVKNVKQTVLVYLFNQQQQVLLIYKKRGMGKGKWNGPGGKLEPGESPEQAVVREVQEETGLMPLGFQQVGTLEFFFPESSESWDNRCAVFKCDSYKGDLLAETPECRSQWVALEAIPYDQMWDDDILWFPLLLENKNFHHRYYFDEQDRMIHKEILL